MGMAGYVTEVSDFVVGEGPVNYSGKNSFFDAIDRWLLSIKHATICCFRGLRVVVYP
jgi:hypothetical protein